ncbi:MAG: hypothetical protein HY674_14675 [Chloroflexi bacterium]|nr:hypothetical protein [Chloroflexota bacterium]
MNELTPIEEGILTSARDDGMIPFPRGKARVVENSFQVMAEMARHGYVEYLKKTWYRAYWLTKKGRRIARALQTVRGRTSACAT